MKKNNRLYNPYPMNRRSLIQYGALGLGGLALNPMLMGKDLAAEEPHYLLVLFVRGGLDVSYLFDARSLDQYKAKLQTNYFKSPQEPTLWTDARGGQTKVTSLVRPLAKWRPYFSVLNGVLMADNFDGHEQNINFALTGNAFGGDWFAPYLNQKKQFSLDGITFVGDIFADFPTNGGGSITLAPAALGELGQSASKAQKSVGVDPLIQQVAARAAALGGPQGSRPPGRLSQGAQLMHQGILDSLPFQKKIAQFRFDESDGIRGLLNASMEVYRAGITRTVALSLDKLPDLVNFEFDVHGAELTRRTPEMYGKVIEAVAAVFETLHKTPYSTNGKSFLDVTTVMLLSDFNRTTRQIGVDLDKSGTDHNPLSNTILLGGKGIRGNMIIGATDLDTLSGKTYANVSPAHKNLDPELIKIMGKPFDVKELKVLKTSPASYTRNQYLTFENVINTVFKAFRVTSKEQLRPYSGDRSGTAAPSLDKLLV